MSVTLHGAAYSVYVRIVRLALAEKGVAHDHVEVDIFAAGGPPPEHLARHPFGKIPTLSHDGFTLFETAAICRYIDEAFDGPALLPRDARSRARAAQVIGLLDAYGYRAMVWDVYVQLAGDAAQEGTTDPAVVEAGMARSETVLDVLERFGAEGHVLDGERITLADLHAAPMLAYFMATAQGREAVAARPQLAAWVSAMRQRPSVSQTRPAEAAW